MTWTLISVILGFLFIVLKTVIFGDMFFEPFKPLLKQSIIRLSLLLIGLSSLIYFTHLIEKADKIRLIKMKICRDIEKNYDFRYNLESEIEKHIKGGGIDFFRFVSFLISILYLLTGLIILKNSFNSYTLPLFIILILLGLSLFINWQCDLKCNSRTD